MSAGRSRHVSARDLIRAKEALERKTAELALSLSMMQATLDSTTDAIIVTDMNGNVRNFNEKYAQMMGVTRAQLKKADVNKLRLKFSQRLALLKSSCMEKRSKSGWPQLVNVVGQAQQESLFALGR